MTNNNPDGFMDDLSEMVNFLRACHIEKYGTKPFIDKRHIPNVADILGQLPKGELKCVIVFAYQNWPEFRANHPELDSRPSLGVIFSGYFTMFYDGLQEARNEGLFNFEFH